MKTAFVIKKEGMYLVNPDLTMAWPTNYSNNIDEAGIIETEYDAEDVVAAGKIEGISGEIAVGVTIEIKEV